MADAYMELHNECPGCAEKDAEIERLRTALGYIRDGIPGPRLFAVEVLSGEWESDTSVNATPKCDCEAPDGPGVRLVSNSCPIHNDNPVIFDDEGNEVE